MHSCFKLSLTLTVETQSPTALLYAQKGLVVARAAPLQGGVLYASLLEAIIDICVDLKYAPATLGFRHGELTIPYEGFIAAVPSMKRRPRRDSEKFAQIDTFIQKHTCWVKELQAELVRCEGLAFSHVCFNQLVSPLINSFNLALRKSKLSTLAA